EPDARRLRLEELVELPPRPSEDARPDARRGGGPRQLTDDFRAVARGRRGLFGEDGRLPVGGHARLLKCGPVDRGPCRRDRRRTGAITATKTATRAPASRTAMSLYRAASSIIRPNPG